MVQEYDANVRTVCQERFDTLQLQLWYRFPAPANVVATSSGVSLCNGDMHSHH